MERFLLAVSNFIFKGCKYLLVFLTVEITLIIGANIFGRYLLDVSIYWAEEVTRYSFVWATFFGAACAYRQRSLVSMSVLTNRMPPGLRWKVEVGMDLVMAAFLLIATVYGTQLTMAVVKQTSASLEISMSYVYICVPLACLFMLIFNLTQVVWILKRRQPLGIWGEDWS